jgi:hypothetical protein
MKKNRHIYHRSRQYRLVMEGLNQMYESIETNRDLNKTVTYLPTFVCNLIPVYQNNLEVIS